MERAGRLILLGSDADERGRTPMLLKKQPEIQLDQRFSALVRVLLFELLGG